MGAPMCNTSTGGGRCRRIASSFRLGSDISQGPVSKRIGKHFERVEAGRTAGSHRGVALQLEAQVIKINYFSWKVSRLTTRTQR